MNAIHLKRLPGVVCGALAIAVVFLCPWEAFAKPDPTAAEATSETVARCGDGWLEIIDGYPVLHLKGTPYEMGYQHGALFCKHVQQNMSHMMRQMRDTSLAKLGPFSINAKTVVRVIVETQRQFVPE